MSGCQSYLTNVYVQNPPLRATKNLLNALVFVSFCLFWRTACITDVYSRQEGVSVQWFRKWLMVVFGDW